LDFAASVGDQDTQESADMDEDWHYDEVEEDPESDLVAGATATDADTAAAVEATGGLSADDKALDGAHSADAAPLLDKEDLSPQQPESQGDDGSVGTATLIVRKGQQLQELMVDGMISREQLKHEVKQIVSILLATEEAIDDTE